MNRRKGKFATDGNVRRYDNVKLAKQTCQSTVNDHDYFTHNVADIGIVSHEETVLCDKKWGGGRCVVELRTLADALKKCGHCDQSLFLHNCVSERTIGLAVVLNIYCCFCKNVSTIDTSKKHGHIYDVNTKAATGLAHAGFGLSQLNSFLACMNIVPVQHHLMDRRLKESGQALEAIAEETMEAALREENDSESGIEVSVDGAWQKRGCGRAYDSLSGHCTMIGSKTGRVVAYDVRSKTCRICASAEKKGISPGEHDCRCNWTGSAKAMEADMVASMVEKIKEKGIRTSTIIGDDDSATIKLVRSTVDRAILKRSDKNHLRKTVSGLLYSLKKKHANLSTKVIRYFLKLLGYVLSTNEGDPSGMTEGLLSLGCHPFGDHTHCQSWCKKKEDRGEKFNSLPYGRPLSNGALQADIQGIFNSYLKHSERLCNLGSTQANESLKKTIASKAPKSLHLSGSANLHYRVAAGVAQKNVGKQYVLDVHRKIGLSPGSNALRFLKQQDRQHRKRKAIATSRNAKWRRLVMKQKRSQKKASCEMKEGPTYASNIELTDCSTPEGIPPGVTVKRTADEQPQPHTQVFFDLETTGLERTSDIVQIAARRGDTTFCQYIMPRQPISPSASDVTGVRVCNGQMFVRGDKVDTTDLLTGLQKFLEFIKTNGDSVLYAHNCKSFDCKVLFHSLVRCSLLEEFCKCCIGFVDTYFMFKSSFPDLEKHSQPFLASKFLLTEYNAHNAVDDVVVLQRLTLEVKDLNFKVSYFTTQSANASYLYSINVLKYLHSLSQMTNAKVLSKGMARKVAGSGLSMKHLVLAFERNGSDGIRSVLSESINGCVRVTKCKKVIDAVSQFLSDAA